MRSRKTLVPGMLGAILCLAATLKVVDLFVSSAEPVESALALFGASVELLVGAALLFRIQPAISDPAGGVLFVLLAGVALMGTSRGAARCGCLGLIPVPPWAMLVVDAAAAIALLRGPRAARPRHATGLDAACLGALFTGLAIGSALYPRPVAAIAATSAEAVAAARTVTIEPGPLKGRACVLLPYVRIEADLSRGEWKVILARAGCMKCERRLRSGGCRPDRGERVAVVLAERKEGWAPPEGCQAVVGHLAAEKTWLFDAPLTLRLIDGRVAEAR